MLKTTDFESHKAAHGSNGCGIRARWLFAIIVTISFTGIGRGGNQPPPKTDLILKNGRIWTGVETYPWAEALAISGNRILKIGGTALISSLARQDTRVIDLEGKLVIPGINDAHTHFLSGALGLFQVDLVGAHSLEEIQKRVEDYARAHPDERWITGSGWEYSSLPASRLPTREDLDKIVPDRPVYLSAYDGHTGWANSKAVEIAGVNRDSRFQGYGEMVLDPRDGKPTGAFKEGAQSLVRSAIPAPTQEKKLAAMRRALKLAAYLGICSIQNASGSPQELALYEQLDAGHELTVRVSMAMSLGAATSEADIRQYAALKKKYTGPMLHAGAAKILLDGVIESHTAAMLRPYNDLPTTSGSASFSQADLNRLVALCDAEDLQVWIHAIGDRAVRMALDSYQNALKLHGPHDARFRIEHIETISAADIPRFARLGVLASMEPIHADPGTNEVWLPAVGPEREKRAFPWHSLEKAGALLVFSSDWPATISVDPMRGIHNAVNRRTIEGQPPGAWLPRQRVSVETALRAYTRNAAYASFEEELKGTLAEGKLADIVVLNQDLFKIDPMDIYKTRVVMTILNGRILYP
jgi:predicted amidohydrolase YtcJ